MDRHVETPTNRDAFLDSVGLVFDAGVVFEGELKVRGRAVLDEVDKYFYATISSLCRKNSRHVYLSDEHICRYNGQATTARVKVVDL